MQKIKEDVSVNGYTISALLDGLYLLKKLALNVLKHNNITDIKCNNWYPMSSWVFAINELLEFLGPDIFYQFGKDVPYKTLWPQDICGVHNALRAIDKAYHLNHRGNNIGQYDYTILDDTAGMLSCETPYPKIFDKGLIQSTVSKYKVGETTHNMAITESDSEANTYIIEW